jgi:hypothetical protein
MRLLNSAPLAVVFLALASAAPLDAQAAIPSGAPVDGIRCDAAEGVLMHIHAHVGVFDHGRPVGVPEDVGRPIVAECFYWLHTHTPDGIIHIESPRFATFTLGQFFDVWGQPLTRRDVAGARPRAGERVVVYVQGRPYAGDPRTIDLAQHLDVEIRVGPPYAAPPPFRAWNGL